MLLIIILLLIILGIIWMMLVKDVDVEKFSRHHQNKIILKFGDKYLEGHKDQPLKLGINRSFATYYVSDLNDYEDGIRLESAKFLGYYIFYTKKGWVLKSQYYTKNHEKSLFLPMSVTNRKKVMLVCYHNNKCLTVDGNRVLASEASENPLDSQLLTFRSISL